MLLIWFQPLATELTHASSSPPQLPAIRCAAIRYRDCICLGRRSGFDRKFPVIPLGSIRPCANSACKSRSRWKAGACRNTRGQISGLEDVCSVRVGHLRVTEGSDSMCSPWGLTATRLLEIVHRCLEKSSSQSWQQPEWLTLTPE